MKKSSVETTLLIVVAIITALNVLQFFKYYDYGSLIVVLLGVIWGAIYLTKKQTTPAILYLWIIVQIPQIATASFTYMPSTDPINIAFGLTANTFLFKINIVPLLLFGLYRFSVNKALVGETFEIQELKKSENSILGKVLPLTSMATDSQNFQNDKKNWLKIKLDNPIVLNDETYQHIFISPKSEEKYNKKKYIVCFVKLGNETKSPALKEWAKVIKK